MTNYIQQNGRINKREKIGQGRHRIEDIEIDEFNYSVLFSTVNGSILKTRQMHIIDEIDIGVNIDELPLTHQDAIYNQVNDYISRLKAKKTVNDLNQTLGSIFNHFK
mgnify:CR=1 FL=1